MIEQWILDKIEPLKPAPLIILRDPQRMIQAGAYIVDGWAEENGYTVLFCAGNMALREMYEAVREDADARVLLVDRSRKEARIPLFYPDLAAQAGPRREMALSLRDFLVEQTGDPNWPHLADDRQLSRLILENLSDTLGAHEQLRQVGGRRFSDTDLYKILLGAALKINPFKRLSASEIRRLCIEQHHTLEELSRVLLADVMDTLRQTIARAPKPFCWLLERDPDLVVRAFTLSAIMHQHGLEYQVLLSNLDPTLHEYREMAPAFLDQAMEEQLAADPERVVADVGDVEDFLMEDPKRLAFLLHDRLRIDDTRRAFEILKRERLSSLIRGMALVSLLADLIESRGIKFHRKVLELLDRQTDEISLPALSRPTEQWQALERAYRRAFEVYRLAAELVKYAKKFQVTEAKDLSFAEFDELWNQERLNRLDYYTSDLDRTLRVGDILPIPLKAFWPELEARWEKVRTQFSEAIQIIGQVQNLLDHRFQDFYRLYYKTWIQDGDAPVVLTHQFLARMLAAHWDPQSGRKAVVMVFDGLRTDAWDEFLRPVFEERFELIESRPGSALIPTETHLSRKAISAGCLPQEFTSTNELELLRAWLKEHMGLMPHFRAVRDDDTVASGMTVRYVSDQLEYIVFNFTDRNLHNNPQDLAFIYDTTVREIIRQDVRSVLRELPDDALIFITSDHGFIPVPEPTVTVPKGIVVDSHDVKYRVARTTAHLEGRDSQNVIEFDARMLGIPQHSEMVPGAPIHYILFPRPGFTLRRRKGRHAPDRYTHGGLGLAECMVPMVVMGPRRQAKPILHIESVQQAGSVSEGEELELEITVVPMQMALPDMAITLAFSRDEIPTHREVFRGVRTTYNVRWTPQLGEVTEDDRRQGVVVQPVTVILTYRNPVFEKNRVSQGEIIRLSKTTDVRIKLDPTRLRRRVDSKLDLLMGKVPKGLK
jgi:RNAse (barnase) inhibitor barstar